MFNKDYLTDRSLKNLYSNIGMDSEEVKLRMDAAYKLSAINSDNGNPNKSSLKGGVRPKNFSLPDSELPMPIIADSREELQAIVRELIRDADTYQFNISSSGVPIPLTTIWTTKMIQQLYKATTLDQICGSWQQGSPGVTNVQIPTIGYSGYPQVYSDYSAGGNTSVNVNYYNAPIAYFEQSLSYGDMSQAQFSLAHIDLVTQMREAAAVTFSQFQNDIGFNGATTVGLPSPNIIYGLLNNPALPPAIVLPADGNIPGTVTPTTAFSGKSYNQITRDILLLMNSQASAAQGQTGTDMSKLKGSLILPSSEWNTMSTTNQFGATVSDWFKSTYPNINILSSPNLEAPLVDQATGINNTMIFLILDMPSGEKAADELFVSKWIGHRPIPMASSVTEKISCGLGGVIVKYGFAISYAFGV